MSFFVGHRSQWDKSLSCILSNDASAAQCVRISFSFATLFMRVHTDLHHLPEFRNAVLTIGTFDGVHKGHLKIIRQMQQEASAIGGETLIITFHPHPRNIIGSSAGRLQLLTTLDERISLLDALGVDHLVVIPFTKAFAAQAPEEYVSDFLVRHFHPHTVIIGYDHRFGKDRQGDYHLLEALSDRYGFRVKEIDAQLSQESTISSTRIREALKSGDTSLAEQLLGYPYFIGGEVVHGDKRGRTIGFPTANLRLQDAEKLLPADGVYAIRLSIPEDKGGWILKDGMMNVGVRPTVDGMHHLAEVNIFDFNDDIYGKKIKVTLHRRLRAELKFPSLEALRLQLEKDRDNAISGLRDAARQAL